MEITYGITYGNYVSLLFVIVTFFLSRHNYVIYLFDVVTFFDDVRITLYFGTPELGTEITLHYVTLSFFSYVCNQKMTKQYVIVT